MTKQSESEEEKSLLGQSAQPDSRDILSEETSQGTEDKAMSKISSDRLVEKVFSREYLVETIYVDQKNRDSKRKKYIKRKKSIENIVHIQYYQNLSIKKSSIL